MRRFGLTRIAVVGVLLLIWSIFTTPGIAEADSLSLLMDYQYEVFQSQTDHKTDSSRDVESDQATFSQLYSLDIVKEIFPTLKLNFGGLFDQDSTRTDRTGANAEDSESRSTAIRPFFDLQFATELFRASANYRKNQLKESSSISDPRTTRDFSDEYGFNLVWKPVELPELEFDYNRFEVYDEPLSNDQTTDTYQLRSRYNYKFFRFTYNHTTTDTERSVLTGDPLNPREESQTLNHSDNGSVRFNRTFYDGKLGVSSSLRASRQQAEFSGDADRLVSVSVRDDSFSASSDLSPLSNLSTDFSSGLSQIDFLSGGGQLSIGIAFGASNTENLDTLHIHPEVREPNVNNNQATPSEIASIATAAWLANWRVFISDDELSDNPISWSEIPISNIEYNQTYNRFEISFNAVETSLIKIVLTPLPTTSLPNKELFLSEILGYRTLPPNTSEFSQTDWTADLNLNWKHSAKTSSGYDFLYREQRSEPFSEKKTQLSYGARVSHKFNDIFLGNMRLQRSELRERDENPTINHIYSASLAARYLETFDQSLTYSFSHEKDKSSNTSITNAFFLRSNLDLYQGWSLALDKGFSWQNPGLGADTNTTFVTLSSKVSPNNWLNMTLSYGISWDRVTGRPLAREQDGRLVVSLVPTRSLSLTADLTYSDDSGEVKDSTSEQRYSLNWSPFRNGTLLFNLGYSQQEDDEDEQLTSLSPSLRWQINRKTLLTLEYTYSEKDDRDEVVTFNNIILALRLFY
jgi:hypothetical protein